MTLYFLDPNLTKSGGHHYDWNLLIADSARKRGEDVVFFAHRDCPPSKEASLEVIPWFSQTCYDKRSTAPYTAKFDDFRFFNDTLADELAGLPHSRFTALDCVFVPTLTEIHMLGYVSWMKTFDPMTAPLFVVHLMFPSGLSVASNTPPEIVDPEQASFYGLAFQKAAEPGPHIHFFGGGRQIAREFAELSGLDIEPHPIPWRPIKRLSTKVPPNPSVLLYAGDAKADKGFGLLPEITETLARGYPNWTFLVHANDATAWGETRLAFDAMVELAQQFSNVQLRTGRLSREDYDDLQRQADAMISTYDPVAYARKSSGVLWESISLGLPVLAPEGTWMSKEAEEWGAGCMTYAPYSARVVCERFQDFASQLGVLKERSRPAAVLYRARNGGEAIFNQFAALWSARWAAAKLVGQPTVRKLLLEAQSGYGLSYLETVDGRPVRWTAKEFEIAFDWDFPNPWELTLTVPNFIAQEQVLGAQAQDTSGDALSVVSQVEEGVGVIVVSGPGGGSKGKRVVRIALPWTYRPDGETRDLGVVLRDITIGPGQFNLAEIGQTKITLLTDVSVGSGGEFKLDRPVSGVVALDPWRDANFSMTLESQGDIPTLRAIGLYVNGDRLPLNIANLNQAQWSAVAAVSKSLIARGGYSTQWDIVNPAASPAEITVLRLGFNQRDKSFALDAANARVSSRRSKTSHSSVKAAPTLDSGSAVKFASVVVDEYIPGVGEYRHIGFSIHGLTDGRQNWEHVKFNFCNHRGINYLEFRNNSNWPKCLRIWPGRKEDGFGPYVKIPDPDEGCELAPLNDSRDRALMRSLCEVLNVLMKMRQFAFDNDYELWREEAALFSQTWLDSFALETNNSPIRSIDNSAVEGAFVDNQRALLLNDTSKFEGSR